MTIESICEGFRFPSSAELSVSDNDMNIVLFEAHEIDRPIPRSDPRVEHVLKVLRRKTGDTFDAGLIDGPKGKATVVSVGEDAVRLAFEWGQPERPLYPVDLIVGLSRPQTNRKILHEATSLGVRSMRFVATERGELSYASSRLWTTDEWRRHVVAGAAQAFSTRLPEVGWGLTLDEALARVSPAASRLALDNYEAPRRLTAELRGNAPVALAVGSERGWTGPERDLLRQAGFKVVHLGERVLRTETAVVAAVSQVIATVDEPI